MLEQLHKKPEQTHGNQHLVLIPTALSLANAYSKLNIGSWLLEYYPKNLLNTLHRLYFSKYDYTKPEEVGFDIIEAGEHTKFYLEQLSEFITFDPEYTLDHQLMGYRIDIKPNTELTRFFDGFKTT